MFQIADGRECFYQWDLNRQIIVNDASINELHFCNKTDDCSLVVEVEHTEVFANGKSFIESVANVPNILLQNDFPIRVYAYCKDGYTKIERVFKVISRTKPTDYVYTETEVKRWEDLEKRIEELENSEVDLTGYATEEYVDEAINAIDIPDTDLTGYATEEYVDEAVNNLQETKLGKARVTGDYVYTARDASSEYPSTKYYSHKASGGDILSQCIVARDNYQINAPNQIQTKYEPSEHQYISKAYADSHYWRSERQIIQHKIRGARYLDNIDYAYYSGDARKMVVERMSEFTIGFDITWYDTYDESYLQEPDNIPYGAIGRKDFSHFIVDCDYLDVQGNNMLPSKALFVYDAPRWFEDKYFNCEGLFLVFHKYDLSKHIEVFIPWYAVHDEETGEIIHSGLYETLYNGGDDGDIEEETFGC